ncbi:MAG TPA: TonB-dependent receptor [Longimicrobium sp.]|jgi:outer membrane receptor protein involved in Fe transport
MQRFLIATLALSVLSGAAQLPGQSAPVRNTPVQLPAAGNGEIRGVVVDAAGAPLASASVSVLDRADSTLVAGAVALRDGSFRVAGLPAGTYYLRVSVPGYGTHVGGSHTVAPAAPRAEAGRIRLARSAVALEGIVVTGARQAATMTADRNAYRTRDVAPAATTASEVLETIPSVQVDGEGRLSLRGNENVVIQINGRPSPLRGEQLAGYLRQLPARTIERVEVVPNPSASQDPDGMAGIVNIVLKQNAQLGVSGGFTLSASTAVRYAGTGNFGYQKGPATLVASYGFTSDDRAQSGVNDLTRLGAGRAPLSYTEQDVRGSRVNRGHNLNASLDYRLNGRDVLSSALLLNLRGTANESFSGYSVLDGSRLLLDSYERVRDADGEASMADYTLAFKRTLEPRRHELSAEVRVSGSREADHASLWSLATPAAAAHDLESTRTNVRSYQVGAQVDYVRGLAARTRLETGYKGTFRSLERDFTLLRDPAGTGDWVSAGLSNGLEFSESVNAVYGTVNQGAGKLELQGGLRAEYAGRDFALADADERFPYQYASFFPSAMASYAVNDRTQVKASYSRRIRRPGTQELNPFPSFFDAQIVFRGNPRLSPEYTDAFEVGVQRSGELGTLQLSPFYRRTSDVIRFIANTADTIAGREVTSINFTNMDSGSSWGTDLNGTLRLGTAFSGIANVNVYKIVTEGGSGEASLSSESVTWSARLNGTANLGRRTSVTGMYSYRAPIQLERGRFEPMGFADLSAQHRLRGDKVNVTARLSDVFNTQKFRALLGDDNLIQLTERASTSRALHLSVQYNFGRVPATRPRPVTPAEAPSPFPG